MREALFDEQDDDEVFRASGDNSVLSKKSIAYSVEMSVISLAAIRSAIQFICYQCFSYISGVQSLDILQTHPGTRPLWCFTFPHHGW